MLKDWGFGDFDGDSTFPIKHGLHRYQELKTWGSATPEAPSADSTLLAEDHMRCGGIWPEILRQLQSASRQLSTAFGYHYGRNPRWEDTLER